METIDEFCRAVLLSGDLTAKLRPPSALAFAPQKPVNIDTPARSVDIRLTTKTSRLPKQRALKERANRAVVLGRFAHHELVAIEMMAWGILRFPTMPERFVRGMLSVLRDEQVHCQLYLDRLAAHGSHLCEHELNDYMWVQTQKIDTPEAFLAVVGLTFEQANLDFALMFKDAFARAGDEQSASVLQRVHDDEVTHVMRAATWLTRLTGASQLASYQAHVPAPLGAVRAKGRIFDERGRLSAGLTPEFIAYIKNARPINQR